MESEEREARLTARLDSFTTDPRVDNAYVVDMAAVPGSGVPSGKPAWGAILLRKIDGDELMFSPTRETWADRDTLVNLAQDNPWEIVFAGGTAFPMHRGMLQNLRHKGDLVYAWYIR